MLTAIILHCRHKWARAGKPLVRALNQLNDMIDLMCVRMCARVTDIQARGTLFPSLRFAPADHHPFRCLFVVVQGGVDDKAKTELVESGIFAYTRHPIYIGCCVLSALFENELAIHFVSLLVQV